MSFWESIRVALTALRANKLRSVLTMLGVIIGVGSVIVMISIIQGARQQVVKEFEGIGSDLIFVEYAPRPDRRGAAFAGLRMPEIETIRRRADLVAYLSPILQEGVQATRGKRQFGAQAVGVTENYRLVTSIDLARGRFLIPGDMESWRKVCVLGDKVRRELFGNEEALGREIAVQHGNGRLALTVVGVLEKKGRGFGAEIDNQILAPLPTLQKRLTGSDRINSVRARAAGGQSEAAADQVFAALKQMYPNYAQDFVVDTQEGLLKSIDRVLIVFQIILGGVGGLSLLVGGIGIMNIMLVSVTERTREIGIRKAVGAKQRDILVQFITESMTVSGIGGLIGVAFGYGLSKLIGLGAGEQLPTFVPLWAAGLGFGFAVSVGMFFGIYPAFRAARLDPIQALRYE